MNRDVNMLFDLFVELVEAIEEEDPDKRKRKLHEVKVKAIKEKPTLGKRFFGTG
jgi:hypothetical protein